VIQQITKLNIIPLCLCLPKTTCYQNSRTKSLPKVRTASYWEVIIIFTWYITSSLSHFLCRDMIFSRSKNSCHSEVSLCLQLAGGTSGYTENTATSAKEVCTVEKIR